MTSGSLFTGKTVEDAIAEGLRALGLTRDQVEVEVVSRGSRGLFGIGSEPAQVRLAPRAPAKMPAAPPPPISSTSPATLTPELEQAAPAVRTAVVAAAEPAAAETEETEADGTEATSGALELPVEDDELVAMAVELLSEVVRLMGFEVDIVASWREPDADNDEHYLLLNLHGRELGALIGRRGETLNNLQYLLRLMVNQRVHQWKNIVVDVEQYRQHRVEHLTQLALRSADQVAQSGRPLALEPMPPNERRIVHLALRDHPEVYTESSGEGERRKIQVLPKRS